MFAESVLVATLLVLGKEPRRLACSLDRLLDQGGRRARR